jgi:hypothetical protein
MAVERFARDERVTCRLSPPTITGSPRTRQITTVVQSATSTTAIAGAATRAPIEPAGNPSSARTSPSPQNVTTLPAE